MIPKIYFKDVSEIREQQRNSPNISEAVEICDEATRLAKIDPAKAIVAFDKVLNLIPDIPEVLFDLSNCYANLGNEEKSREYLIKTLEIWPWFPPAVLRIPEYFKLSEEDADILIPQINGLLRKLSSVEDVALLNYTLAQLYRIKKDWDNEFYHLNIHNTFIFDFTKQTANYNFHDHIHVRNALTSLANNQSDINDYETPVFIVSMPRSGSTLVDQVLSTHSQVESLGESSNLDKLFGYVNHEAEEKGVLPAAKERGDEYHDLLKQVYPDARYVLDKMPNNYLKINGIKQIFPKAKIIYCLRDPMATCYSIWKSRLGSPKSYMWATDLYDLGRYYNQIFMPILNHWKKTYPDDVHIVQYEDMVLDFENTVGKLLDFLDLEHEDLKEFYTTQRDVLTISRWQVRKPIYKDSLDEWKRYEKHLQPLRDGLAVDEIKRECGNCHVCCVETEIDDPKLTKACNEICPKLDLLKHDKKCKIYKDAPSACKEYTCSWLDGYGSEFDQPSKNHVIAHVANANGGTWVFVRELRENSFRTTGRNLVRDLIVKSKVPVIVKLFNSPSETGDWVLIREELMPRSKRIRGEFIDWFDDDESIGIYELVKE